jgi:EAL domain-containing protein (putative c-di-GMP-specific phosphodiesterase class I)
MKEPFRVRDDEVFVTVSAGIAIGPRDGQDAEELVRSADTAMFHAKDQGRNNVQFFNDRMNVRAVERLKIETNLRRAIERSEFLLYYQPQIDIATNQVIGAEALIRWQHPEDGMVMPGRFIPVAEETGLIVQIGDWALRETCRQIKAWEQEGVEPIRISVNLSFKQFRKPDFVESVENAIAESGIDPHYLDFELTESMVMHDVDHAIQILKRIKALGIEISIDDFGTGYSSLNHIRRLPIDIVKIDKSFVNEVSTSKGDAEIATAIVALAHSLNLKVIAEGVETAEQLSFLSSRNCNAFQGYLASPAIAPDDFKRFRLEWNARAQRATA